MLSALLGATPASVHAGEGGGFANATALRTWCQGKGAVQAHCLGYIAGVVDGIEAAPPCLPPRLAVQQARDLFLNHLHRHPERGDAVAALEVRAALAAAFPCSRKPPAGSRSDGRVS